MLQTMAQMGFKHLPGEGRVFAQDLFYPSSYTSMGGPKGTQCSSEWTETSFFPFVRMLLLEMPLLLASPGASPAMRQFAVRFSMPLLPAHRRVPSGSTAGTASN